MGTPALRMIARVMSLSGQRTPTVESPAVVLLGTKSLAGRISVSGPGQNVFISIQACSGTSWQKFST